MNFNEYSLILEDFDHFRSFWSISCGFLAESCTFPADFCRFCVISAHSGSSPPASAGHEGHGLGRPLPREAAPLKNLRNINDFQSFSSVCTKGRPRPRGLGRSLLPRAAVDFLCNSLNISADSRTFLCGNLFDFGSNFVIFMKFHKIS